MPFASIRWRIGNGGRNEFAALDQKRERNSDRLNRVAHRDLAIHHPDKRPVFEHRDDFGGDASGAREVFLRPFQPTPRVAALLDVGPE